MQTLLTIVMLMSAAPSQGVQSQPVLLVSDGQRTTLAGVAPEPRWRTRQVLILSFSRDLLTIDGVKSAHRVKTTTPTLIVSIAAGATPADVVHLIRLTPKDGRREVGRDQDAPSGVEEGDLLPLAIERVESDTASAHLYRIRPTSPIKPGEYAVILSRRFYAFGVD